ncbi:hypothetical protein M2157_009763 [Streptomyces sp. SAI-127]|nr:hypothetical protein [Streptomyces sp. SAI-127]
MSAVLLALEEVLLGLGATHCGPLPARHGRHQPFRDVITDIENNLDLHQRTAGRIGSLTRLIRQAAITAICDGTERITKKSLDAIRLDHLAEPHSRPAPKR